MLVKKINLPPKKLTDQIFDLDPKIRYAVIVDQYGEYIEGRMRRGVKSLNPEKEEKKLNTQTAVARGMAKTWEDYFGKQNFSIISHEKMILFRFPFGKDIVLVTAEPEVSLDIANRICDYLKSAG